MDEKFEYCTCIFEVLALEEFFFVTRRCSQALLTAQSEGRHRTRFYMVRCMKYKIAKIAKVTGKCPACEEYAEMNTTNPSKIAVMACKGACAKGEVARRAANMVAHHLARDETLRIRLGGAFTKDTGPRNLIRRAEKMIAIEGCIIACSSRMIAGVLPDFRPAVVQADTRYDGPFPLDIDKVPDDMFSGYTYKVAEQVVYEHIQNDENCSTPTRKNEYGTDMRTSRPSSECGQ